MPGLNLAENFGVNKMAPGLKSSNDSIYLKLFNPLKPFYLRL